MPKRKDKEYILTDQCFFYNMSEKERKEYNGDPGRTPHAVTIVDVNTGTIKQLESGSIIKIIKEHKYE